MKVSFLSEIEDRTNKPKASTWRILDAGAAAGVLDASAALLAAAGAMQPDYSTLAAMSFGSIAGAGADPRVSPYGMTIPGLAMPTAMPGLGTPGLPAGWEVVTDPSTGKPYYCNRATGESSW